MSTQEIFLRNQGYIAPEDQAALARTRLLIAGCGVGSFLAEGLLRAGFIQQTLVDGDQIEVHNLNRQNFLWQDIGELKAEALAGRLNSIHPEARVTAVSRYLDSGNVASLVSGADIVIDTIDFLDLNAICLLHDEANRRGVPVISALSAGWGAFAVVLMPRPGKTSWFRELFDLPEDRPVRNESYAEKFRPLFTRLAEHLSPAVVSAMSATFQVMEDGKPCPAPHVSAGTLCAGALVTTLAVRVACRAPVTKAPEGIAVDLLRASTIQGIPLTAP